MALGDREIERSLQFAVKAGAKRTVEQKRAFSNRQSALDRSERREWAHSRLGDEHRWQETIGGKSSRTARRFIYDAAQDAVVEITN